MIPWVYPGKVLIYQCGCGRRSVHAMLDGKMPSCPWCQMGLEGRPYYMDDLRRMLREQKPGVDDDVWVVEKRD